MPNFRRALAIAITLNLIGCSSVPLRATDSTGSTAAAVTPHCDIAYSNIPYYANEDRLGADRLEQIAAIRQSFDVEQDFIESFASITETIIDQVAGEDINPLHAETVMGGYKGFTSPSLTLRFAINDRMSREHITQLSSAIGYVYLQDSVLVRCDPEPGDTQLYPAFELTETGPVDSINVDTLKSIYGALIGEADGNLEMGFSYYPSEDRFSTIGFIDGGKGERAALANLVNTLEVLTNQAGEYVIDERTVWVSFPANDWKSFPEGSNYVTHGNLAELRVTLDGLQDTFIKAIDAYLLRNE